jgi:hypothetical protein
VACVFSYLLACLPAGSICSLLHFLISLYDGRDATQLQEET